MDDGRQGIEPLDQIQEAFVCHEVTNDISNNLLKVDF